MPIIGAFLRRHQPFYNTHDSRSNPPCLTARPRSSIEREAFSEYLEQQAKPTFSQRLLSAVAFTKARNIIAKKSKAKARAERRLAHIRKQVKELEDWKKAGVYREKSYAECVTALQSENHRLGQDAIQLRNNYSELKMKTSEELEKVRDEFQHYLYSNRTQVEELEAKLLEVQRISLSMATSNPRFPGVNSASNAVPILASTGLVHESQTASDTSVVVAGGDHSTETPGFLPEHENQTSDSVDLGPNDGLNTDAMLADQESDESSADERLPRRGASYLDSHLCYKDMETIAKLIVDPFLNPRGKQYLCHTQIGRELRDTIASARTFVAHRFSEGVREVHALQTEKDLYEAEIYDLRRRAQQLAMDNENLRDTYSSHSTVEKCRNLESVAADAKAKLLQKEIELNKATAELGEVKHAYFLAANALSQHTSCTCGADDNSDRTSTELRTNGSQADTDTFSGTASSPLKQPNGFEESSDRTAIVDSSANEFSQPTYRNATDTLDGNCGNSTVVSKEENLPARNSSAQTPISTLNIVREPVDSGIADYDESKLSANSGPSAPIKNADNVGKNSGPSSTKDTSSLKVYNIPAAGQALSEDRPISKKQARKEKRIAAKRDTSG